MTSAASILTSAGRSIKYIDTAFQNIDDIWDWVLDNPLQGWDGRLAVGWKVSRQSEGKNLAVEENTCGPTTGEIPGPLTTHSIQS